MDGTTLISDRTPALPSFNVAVSHTKLGIIIKTDNYCTAGIYQFNVLPPPVPH